MYEYWNHPDVYQYRGLINWIIIVIYGNILKVIKIGKCIHCWGYEVKTHVHSMLARRGNDKKVDRQMLMFVYRIKLEGQACKVLAVIHGWLENGWYSFFYFYVSGFDEHWVRIMNFLLLFLGILLERQCWKTCTSYKQLFWSRGL